MARRARERAHKIGRVRRSPAEEKGPGRQRCHTLLLEMVLVHSIHESGKDAVEVLAEESSGASQAAEAFR